ncbi:hypothetical protein PIB30_040841 [Stylosanthes scabra]|uniref:Uncharacterized protein n=1 Tax=Stylosanthes scabra TaxID=79078 RepID=A0ABU6XCF2_9FABA|nr:hypothetical protein [Stylosanthes scabra]
MRSKGAKKEGSSEAEAHRCSESHLGEVTRRAKTTKEEREGGEAGKICVPQREGGCPPRKEEKNEKLTLNHTILRVLAHPDDPKSGLRLTYKLIKSCPSKILLKERVNTSNYPGPK